mgnify:CR=1 FL=1
MAGAGNAFVGITFSKAAAGSLVSNQTISQRRIGCLFGAAVTKYDVTLALIQAGHYAAIGGLIGPDEYRVGTAGAEAASEGNFVGCSIKQFIR